MLNINRLRLLREVANRKTIAATAESFFMTPSAVSQQLGVLEREAGVDLLQRDGRGVKLTPAGETLVKNSEAIFSAIEHAEADLIDTSRGLTGSVTMAAFPTSARSLVIPAFNQLRIHQPNLHLRVLDQEPEDSLPSLGTGEIDLAVYYEWTLLPSIKARGLQTHDLLSETVYLCLPRTDPLAASANPVRLVELAEKSWIAGRESTSMLQLVSTATALAGFTPQASFQSMDFDVIIGAVEAGLGVALVPPLAFLHRPPSPKVVYKTISDLDVHRTIKVALRTGSESNPLIHEVLTTLQAQAHTTQTQLDVFAETQQR